MARMPVPEASICCGESRFRLLRISVTDRCNFRCRYCTPPGGNPTLSHEHLLPLEEIASLAQWLAARLGIERIKLTGGEPLVRRGLPELVRQLAGLSGINQISLTTNGSRLGPLAADLKEAGLARVNVSLDTLDPTRFHDLTRGGRLEDTLAGISAATAVQLVPLKINAVLQRSSWERDVPLLLDYAAANGLELRFIELMRTGTARSWCEAELISASRVQLWLAQQNRFLSTFTPEGSPARSSVVRWAGVDVQVGWITPRSHPFCESCERLRMDARGRVYRCLMDSEFFDLNLARKSRGDAEAEIGLGHYLSKKLAPEVMDNTSAMMLIGG
jgi:GTP 3',8-cyclase